MLRDTESSTHKQIIIG